VRDPGSHSHRTEKRCSSSTRSSFELEGVNLRLTDSALTAIADEAVKRKSGARGLRAIMESCMLDIMYEIPSPENVKECVIGEDVVLKKEEPILLYEPSKKQALRQDGSTQGRPAKRAGQSATPD
jgi:ATP-dependent protease Clp ATPase subunit